MSTQHDARIAFSVVPEEDQQHFRLLELPPDLLSLITSEHPPLLQFKSLENTSGQDANPDAVLCTPDKTYSLRQVNHSNSVFITQASSPLLTTSHDFPDQGLEAVAKTGFTLELTAVKNAVPATHYLKATLPIFAPTGHYDLSKSHQSKEQHFANIPLSQHQCEQGWTELACFEASDPAGSFQPSASNRVQAWETMLTQATAEGIDITAPLTRDAVQILADVEADWPNALYRAVLQSMMVEDTRIDRDRCARLVGLALLEHRAKMTACTTSEFKVAWADLLPEQWRSRAELDLLKEKYKLGPDGQIQYVDDLASHGNAASGAVPGDAKAGAKRKWHEKFRASKKTA